MAGPTGRLEYERIEDGNRIEIRVSAYGRTEADCKAIMAEAPAIAASIERAYAQFKGRSRLTELSSHQ